jgi:RNA polymerase-binding transcription factor DksA
MATKSKPKSKPDTKSDSKSDSKTTKKPAVVAKTAEKAAAKPAAKPAAPSKPTPTATRRPTSAATSRPTSSAAIKVKPTAAKPAPKDDLRSPFGTEELGRWRAVLAHKRAEITDDIAALEKDAMEAEDGHTTPQHSAERGSDADIQDVSLNLAGQEKELLWQIDRALRKIDHADPLPYGICEYTKQPIAKGRLENMPWTPLSIEGATHLESSGLLIEDLLMEG